MAPPTSKSKGKLSLRAASSSDKASSSRRPSLPSSSAKASLSSKGKQPQRHPAQASDDDDDQDDDDQDDDSDAAAPMSEPDTDDEIAAAKATKSKKTAKRKRRAVSPSAFGATLQGLLGDAGAGLEGEATDSSDGAEEEEEEGDDDDEAEEGTATKRPKTQISTSQSAILSLAPHIRRAAQSSRLNEKAGRVAVQARKEREERARVKDVIGGWGRPGELPYSSSTSSGASANAQLDRAQREWEESGGAQGYERKLRKVAQRGVVKLFNAIRAAQNTTEDDVEKAELSKSAASKGLGDKEGKNVGPSTKGKNTLGGKDKAVKDLSKANFLELIKAGAGTAART